VEGPFRTCRHVLMVGMVNLSGIAQIRLANGGDRLTLFEEDPVPVRSTRKDKYWRYQMCSPRDPEDAVRASRERKCIPDLAEMRLSFLNRFVALLRDGQSESNFGIATPYIDDQVWNPGPQISVEKLTARLQSEVNHTGWVRSFGSTHGLENLGMVTHSLRLKAAVGAWLSRDTAANNVEIANVIAAANQVRQQIPGNIRVGTADVYGKLLEHPAVISASTIVFPNFYPYWKRKPVNTAIPTLHRQYQQIVAAAGGKPIVISETGWPSDGNAICNAVPSPRNAAFYFLNFVSWARANNVAYYFSGMDENWKSAYGLDGSWECDVTTGGNDPCGTKIVAFLIPKSFSPPQLAGGPTLPATLDKNAVANAEIDRSGRAPDIGGQGLDSSHRGVSCVTMKLSENFRRQDAQCTRLRKVKDHTFVFRANDFRCSSGPIATKEARSEPSIMCYFASALTEQRDRSSLLSELAQPKFAENKLCAQFPQQKFAFPLAGVPAGFDESPTVSFGPPRAPDDSIATLRNLAYQLFFTFDSLLLIRPSARGPRAFSQKIYLQCTRKQTMKRDVSIAFKPEVCVGGRVLSQPVLKRLISSQGKFNFTGASLGARKAQQRNSIYRANAGVREHECALPWRSYSLYRSSTQQSTIKRRRGPPVTFSLSPLPAFAGHYKPAEQNCQLRAACFRDVSSAVGECAGFNRQDSFTGASARIPV